MMNLEDVAAFAAVLEHGNLSRAARAKGVASTTLGRAIDRLEAALGVQLVERTSRAIAATSAGQALLGRCHELLAQSRELEREAADLGKTPRGSVQLSLCPGYSERRLLPALARWATTNPEVSIRLRFDSASTTAAVEQDDIAVRLVRPASGSFVLTRLERYAHALVAAPSYLARRGAPDHPDELDRHATIAVRSEQPWTRWPFRRGQRDVVVDVHPAVEVDDARALVAFTCAGAGITVLPALIARPLLDDGVVHEVLPGWTLPPGTAWLLHAPRRQLGAAARSLIEAFVDAVGSSDRASDGRRRAR